MRWPQRVSVEGRTIREPPGMTCEGEGNAELWVTTFHQAFAGYVCRVSIKSGGLCLVQMHAETSSAFSSCARASGSPVAINIEGQGYA